MNSTPNFLGALAGTIWVHSAKKFGFRLYKNADRFSLKEARSRAPGNRTPLVKSLVAKPNLKNKRLILSGHNTGTVRKGKDSFFINKLVVITN